MNRRAAIGGLVALVCIVALVAFAASHRSAATPASSERAAAAPDVPLATASLRDYTVHVHAQGRVGAPAGSEAKLAFAGTGIIARIDVHVGEAVAAGTPLAELDTTGLQLELAQARADAASASAGYGGGSVPLDALASAQARRSAAQQRLATLERGDGSAQSDRSAADAALHQSQAKVALDQRALDRAVALYTGGVAAQKDVEAARQQLRFDRADADANRTKARSAGAGINAALMQARADLAQAESDVRTAQAQTAVSGAAATSAGARFAAAERNIELATLRAPSAGVVTAILKHVGETADPSQPAVVVGSRVSGVVTLLASGTDAASVRAGDLATVRIIGRSVGGAGTVRSVVPSVDPATQMSTITLDAAVPGAATGDAVEATIDVATTRGIVIPTSAVVEDPETGASIVFVRGRARDGSSTFTARKIAIAASDDTHALVRAGLRGGERIASEGAFDLLAPSGGGG